MFVGDDSIRKMNHRYRGKDNPTDILSFTKPLDFKCPDKNYMGDIVISIDTAKKNAKADGKSLKEELVLLLTHGILHLCGYDHEGVSEYRSKKMMKKQKELLEEIMVWKG
jgi:probable rRNA maturation factor